MECGVGGGAGSDHQSDASLASAAPGSATKNRAMGSGSSGNSQMVDTLALGMCKLNFEDTGGCSNTNGKEWDLLYQVSWAQLSFYLHPYKIHCTSTLNSRRHFIQQNLDSCG
ncbi:hypothetical protein K1719_023904 [Acacia pycnantha]|nr:hypothetical protein K1719_023904 [Acacia pycnantha]